MRWLVRSVVNQASGGARLSTEDPMTQLTGPGAAGTTMSIATEHAPATLTIPGVTVAVGDVRLTIRSSKSVLSESPLGPSASIGIAWAIGKTQAHSTRMTVTSSPARMARKHTPILSELQTTSAASGTRATLTASRAASPIRRIRHLDGN